LYILLAGPILRRAEPEQVCIWTAYSKPTMIKAEIFLLADLMQSDDDDILQHKRTQIHRYNSEIKQSKPIGLGSAKTIQLGERLHVGLVKVLPIIQKLENNYHSNHTAKFTFPTDTLLAYDIEISYLDGTTIKKTQRLKDLGLLSGNNSIVYNSNNGNNLHNFSGNIPLPTFFLPGIKSKSLLNIIHGSCRKLHGKGEDSLSIADKLIGESITELNKRPSVLFLTGDQIYADDVAGPLIQYLTNFGIRLSGWEENIDGIDQKLTNIGVGQRQKLVQQYAKFSSDNASNHLLSFGEFAAMYLLTWNIENWPKLYPDINTIPHGIQRKYAKEIGQLERTRRSLPAIRRVLANIPTYMIFDDHELTDDWNITKELHDAVCSSSCGKQIMANSFAAYWAFQAWGNYPDVYDEKFIAKITDYLTKRQNASIDQRKEFENSLLNFHSWSFYAPTNPPTIFLDCRTQRGYDTINGPPKLLGEEGLSVLLKLIRSAKYDINKKYPLIIVSPTPVFGFELAEELQEYLARRSSVYKWDLETWAANENGFIRFLSFLIQGIGVQNCIFISGDVHYGFTVSASFSLFDKNKKYGKEQEEEKDLRITQLTSSALKTTSFSKELIINEILGRLSQLLSSDKSMRIGWNVGNSTTAMEMTPITKKSSSSFPFKQINQLTGGIIYRILNRILKQKDLDSTIKNRSFDWIEHRTILKPSGFHIPSLVVTDNNIGLAKIAFNNDGGVKHISHELLVRKGNKIKIHQVNSTYS
jgi:PhoD-like phosphatase